MTSSTLNHLNLLRGPRVKIDRLDARYVYAQVPVDTSTTYAHEETQVPTCPSWTYNINRWCSDNYTEFMTENGYKAKKFRSELETVVTLVYVSN